MKKVFCAASLAIALTGCGSDINLVKNGVMDFNKTITLGEALNQWKSCENRTWGEFKTDNSVKVVEFTCVHKVGDFIRRLESLLTQENKANFNYKIISSIEKFQFTINKDNTFQIDNVQNKTTWEGGKSAEGPTEPIEALKAAYRNSMSFDPADLNESTATQVAYAFSMLSIQAKESSSPHTTVIQPKNWDVQYVDASCIVNADAAGADDDAPWHIKMGYLNGNQQIFMFSVANSKVNIVQLPENTTSWLTVDGMDFSSIGISNKNGELVLPVENEMKLQTALAKAKSLGIKIQRQQSTDRVKVMDFNLDNIPGAMKWLETCNQIGVDALPK